MPATMNQTFLLALLSRCRQVILKEIEQNQGSQINSTNTSSTSTTSLPRTTRQSYDNAYFYILFVMFFYSFLALTLFKGFIQNDKTKKDPYEEFMVNGNSSECKYNNAPVTEKIDFDEEISI